jgi:hypothetical protein
MHLLFEQMALSGTPMELSSLLLSTLLELGTPEKNLEIAPVTQAQPLPPDSAPILFRTKNYAVEIFWRRGQPYLSVSNNGFGVIVDRPARIASARGVKDRWTTYTVNSADYRAIVRLGPTGERVIEIQQVGQRIVQEYATFPPAHPPAVPASDSASTPTSTPGRRQKEITLLGFQTRDYAVRVFRQEEDLYMNLYNKTQQVTELKRVPVTRVENSTGTVYRHDGNATVQAREDYRGQRVLLILKNNEIQYRGDGY